MTQKKHFPNNYFHLSYFPTDKALSVNFSSNLRLLSNTMFLILKLFNLNYLILTFETECCERSKEVCDLGLNHNILQFLKS